MEEGYLSRIPQPYRLLGLVMGCVMTVGSLRFDVGPYYWLDTIWLRTGYEVPGMGAVLVFLFTLLLCLLAVVGVLMLVARMLPPPGQEGAGKRKGKEWLAWPVFVVMGVLCFGLGGLGFLDGRGLSEEPRLLVENDLPRVGEPVVVSGWPVAECTIGLREIRRYNALRWETRWFFLESDGERPAVVIRASQLKQALPRPEGDPYVGLYRGPAQRSIRGAMARRGCDVEGDVYWVDQSLRGTWMSWGRMLIWSVGGLLCLGIAAAMRREEAPGGSLNSAESEKES